MINETKFWTDDLPVCHNTGAGISTNQIYKEDGLRQEAVHKFNDRSFHCQKDENTCLYAIFSGHGDSKVAEIALERISAEILLGQLVGKTTEDEIKDVLRQAFVSAENGYMDWAGNFLAQKAMLQAELKGISQYEISRKYKDIVRQLNYINDKLTIGASVVLALIHYSKLYICNIGNCRALLCKSDDNNVLRVVQLSVDHNLYNEDEILRLCQMGLDVQSFKQSPFFTTRCIGNYIGKGGYQDCSFLSSSTSEPILSQPEIVGAIQLDESCRFLLLMSGGLCKTLHDVFPIDTIQVNKEIIQMTVEQFRVQSTLMGVSQSTVHKVVQYHHDTYMRQIEEDDDSDNKCKFNVRDDITLLVRNFNFPMPNAIHKKHSQQHQHQVSFNTNQHHTNSMFDTDSANIITTVDSQYTDTNSSSTYSDIGEHRRIFDKNQKIPPYVSFDDYYRNVEIARLNGKLSTKINFD